jgi:predicted phosphate transport protein (TIGR00153 family)
MSFNILDVFASPPVSPLQSHMEACSRCAVLLGPYFVELSEEKWDAARVYQTEIANLEREADLLKVDFRVNLPESLFLSFSRDLLLDLLSRQERIANTAKDIAGITLGRKMAIPVSIAQDFHRFLNCCVDAVQQAKEAICQLNQILQSGHCQKEIEVLILLIRKLNETEHETDELQIGLRQAVFSIESTLSPIDTFFLYQIIEKIGYLADYADQIGTRLKVLNAS